MVRIKLVALPNPTMTDPKIAPPLGLLYLAAYLRHYGHTDVSIQDLNIEKKLDIEADIIGVSIASTQVRLGKAVCRAIRELNPEAILVIGGPHPTTLPGDIEADYVVQQEGERALLDIADGKPVGKVVCREYIENIDSLPYPARELIDFTKYTRTIGGKPATNIITSRGCPARCVFCDQDVWQNKLRQHSAEYVLGEVDDIKGKTGITRLLFLDDTLTFNRERLLAICAGLKDRGVIWRGWTRANCVDFEMLKEMRRCGCHSLCIGVESGSDKILRNLRKGTTSLQNLEAIKMIKEAGMYARVSLMVGSPGETLETIDETKEFMLLAQPDDWIVSTFVPVVGSPAWKTPDEHGITITTDDYSEYYVVGYDQQSGLVMELDTMSGDLLMKGRRDLIQYLNINVPRKPELVVQ